MNVRSEVRLEIIKDNLPFSLVAPANTSFDTAHEICLLMAAAIKEMKQKAEETAKAQEEKNN